MKNIAIIILLALTVSCSKVDKPKCKKYSMEMVKSSFILNKYVIIPRCLK